MTLIFGRDEELALWVGLRCGATFSLYKSIGVELDGSVSAAVVYSNYRDGNIEATIAADDPRWCRKGVLASLFYYPFVQLGCRRITCLIRHDNERSIRLCEGLGFVREGRCRKIFGEEDGLVYGLIREECRWISASQRGQVQTAQGRLN